MSGDVAAKSQKQGTDEKLESHLMWNIKEHRGRKKTKNVWVIKKAKEVFFNKKRQRDQNREFQEESEGKMWKEERKKFLKWISLV